MKLLAQPVVDGTPHVVMGDACTVMQALQSSKDELSGSLQQHLAAAASCRQAPTPGSHCGTSAHPAIIAASSSAIDLMLYDLRSREFEQLLALAASDEEAGGRRQ